MITEPENEKLGYYALERAERYPELKHIDADLLDLWRIRWGTDPDHWNVQAILSTQLSRNIRELCVVIRTKDIKK